MKAKTVSVIGLGYIGLPTAALLARSGYFVRGVDIDPTVVSTVNRGEVHIVEPGLEEDVRLAVDSGFLQAFCEPKQSDVYIICVPTPLDNTGQSPSPDLTYVYSALRSLTSFLQPGSILILESTCPVGTTEGLQYILEEFGVPTREIHIAYCPERVLPGQAMSELLENDRIVGGLTPVASKAVADFYRSFVKGCVFETNARTAELCKLSENSFRDLNIAFANELSIICDEEGVNVWDLIQLSNRHPRVNILHPGAGVGGHCIAVDPWFIICRNAESSRLIRTAREINRYKTEWVINKIKLAIAKTEASKKSKAKIVCLGLSFKANIDDLRESPALEVAKILFREGFDVVAIEPNIPSHAEIPLVDLSLDFDQVDVIVSLVKHREFLEPDIQRKIKSLNVLDFCGIFAP